MKNLSQKGLLMLFISFFTCSFLISQNNALSFDGVNDYVDCQNILPLSYTKEAWIYITDLTKTNNIISGDPSSQHCFWAPSAIGNKLAAGHNNSYYQLQDPNPLLANTWYHVAVTYDAPTHTMNLYKNGALVSTNPSVNPLTNNNAHVYIGDFNEGLNVFAGIIDEVRIWRVARTTTEIANNMNVAISTPQANLVAYYRFNQGISDGDNTNITQLIDDSGNNYNGDLGFRFALTGSTSNFVISNATVPVELLNFKASTEPHPTKGAFAVLLTWQTASELNNKGFQIERLKPSGNDWEVLGFVDAKGRQANYEFTDHTPLSINYYRLRQIDHDGQEVFSKVVSASFQTTKGLKIYPTLVSNGLLNVEITGSSKITEPSVYGIYNLLGQQVLKGLSTQSIDVSTLPIGTYILKIGTQQATFVKQ